MRKYTIDGKENCFNDAATFWFYELAKTKYDQAGR